MYKNFMLKCQIFNLYTFKWENQTFFFDTEEEMREYIKSQGKGIIVEAMFKLTKIEY